LPASAKKAELLAAYFTHPSTSLTRVVSGRRNGAGGTALLQRLLTYERHCAIGVATNQMAHAVEQNLANIDPDMLCTAQGSCGPDGYHHSCQCYLGRSGIQKAPKAL
jgi:hypothetical protein